MKEYQKSRTVGKWIHETFTQPKQQSFFSKDAKIHSTIVWGWHPKNPSVSMDTDYLELVDYKSWFGVYS